MDQEQHRKIDFQVAALDGGLFPRSMRHDSAPLIELAESAAPPLTRQPISDPPPAGHSISVAPPAPAAPQRRRYLTAAGLAGGLALTALCAVAFQGSLPAHARTAMASGDVVLKDVDLTPEAMPESMSEATAEVESVPEATAEMKAEVAAETPAEVPAVDASPAPASAPAAHPLRAPAARLAPLALPAETPVLPNGLAMLGALPADIDRSGAAIAIAIAGRGAAGCAEPGERHGSMPVSVTFAPSGRVTSARLDGGAFLGTPVGSCIARALRSATVHPFEGSPVTVHGSVHLD